VDDAQGIDFVAEEFDAVCDFFGGGPDFDHVPANAKLAPFERDIVALILNIDEFEQYRIAVDDFALAHVDHHALVVAGRSEAVDAGDARHDDGIGPGDERGRGREAEAVDIFVDARIFFDVDITLRYVGFGLVIIVVADEVADGVVREERLEFLVELRGERLVVGEHERGPAELGNDIRSGKRLAGARGAEQDLHFLPGLEPGDEFLDGLGLIPGGLVFTVQSEERHR
jgi:hypothetical protein